MADEKLAIPGGRPSVCLANRFVGRRAQVGRARIFSPSAGIMCIQKFSSGAMDDKPRIERGALSH